MATEAKLSDLPHKTVVLAATGTNDDYGNPTTGPPVEIDSRWEEGQQTTQQALATSSLNVATVFVPEPIKTSSVLWRGTLEEFNSTPVPDRLYKVMQCSRIDDVKGIQSEFRLLVSSVHDKIPSG